MAKFRISLKVQSLEAFNARFQQAGWIQPQNVSRDLGRAKGKTPALVGKDECLNFIENDKVAHAITPRHDALHLARVLRAVYKLRSQRGSVHVSPTYRPNHMDSKFMIESVRWCLNETLRIFWQGDREMVAKAIRELLQFDVPCIGRFDDIVLVQRTNLTAEEEILVLLHYAGESGFSRAEVGRHCQFAPSTVTRVIQKLESPRYRQIVHLSRGHYRLSDLGAKRLREELADKLVLQ